MINLKHLLALAVKESASDIFLISGQPPTYKAANRFFPVEQEKIMPESARILIESAYQMASRDMKRLLLTGDDDFAFSVPDLARFRISTYKQRGSLAAVIRIISFGIPDYRKLGIPEQVMSVAQHTKGLVLVTGPAGNGKSTTLACLIDRINQTRQGHIITLEEPIEFLYRNERCIISQREMELDTQDYVTALRACLRQAPDVILVGEMRDYETIRTAMTAAETGHLILSTLHTLGASNTIDRIIDIFPPNQQPQIRIQLSMLLRSVVSQQLVPAVDGGVVPAFEIMHSNHAIRNMIRESKVHQIDSVISSSAGEGMLSMDANLLDLYQRGRISEESALHHALGKEWMAKRIHMEKQSASGCK